MIARPALRFVLLMLLIMTCCGCADAAVRAPVEALRQGSLAPEKEAGLPPTLYLTWRDHSGQRLSLAGADSRWARQLGYTLVDSPSKAAYILHIDILAAGRADPARLRDLVARGYGSPGTLSGSGAAALLADLLLVRRRVPSAARPGHQRLGNIARRNAIGSGQARLALFVRGGAAPGPGLSPAYSEAFLRELGLALRRKDR